MRKLLVFSIQGLIVLGLIASLALQTLVIPAMFTDMPNEGPDVERLRWPVTIMLFLGVLAAEVSAIAVWRLLTKVRRGTILFPAAIPGMNLLIGALTFGALMLFGLAAIVAPRDPVAPGVVMLIGCLGGGVLGLGLMAAVLRGMLREVVGAGSNVAANGS